MKSKLMAVSTALVLLILPFTVDFSSGSPIEPNLACAAGDCAGDCGCNGGDVGCCRLQNGATCLMTPKVE